MKNKYTIEDIIQCQDKATAKEIISYFVSKSKIKNEIKKLEKNKNKNK